MIDAYPLTWPEGWPRTNPGSRKRAQFGKRESQGDSAYRSLRDITIAEGTTRVLDGLRILGVLHGDAIISSNLKLRLDGLPISNQSPPADPGVAVYWQRPGDKGTKCMAIDRYDRVADNLAAIGATLDAMRAIERHGGAQILERAFTGFTALPAPGQTSSLGWREVLGFDTAYRPHADDIEVAYKRLRSKHHPDKPGGTAETFNAVQVAYAMAMQELAP